MMREAVIGATKQPFRISVYFTVGDAAHGQNRAFNVAADHLPG